MHRCLRYGASQECYGTDRRGVHGNDQRPVCHFGCVSSVFDLGRMPEQQRVSMEFSNTSHRRSEISGTVGTLRKHIKGPHDTHVFSLGQSFGQMISGNEAQLATP
jgi:hypothetical protein